MAELAQAVLLISTDIRQSFSSFQLVLALQLFGAPTGGRWIISNT
jgi:hypothetical protein